MTFDDSALFHARSNYDPAKAHEYYERTKKTKGRRPAAAKPEPKGRQPSAQEVPGARPGAKPNRADTDSRRAELKAKRDALEKRLDRLRDVLAELVKAAKKRSGGDPNASSKDKGGGKSDKAPETKADKADRNTAEKKSKPETASQKKERASKAKEAYEKEHPNTLSEDVDILEAQVEDIQKKIQAAMSADQARRKKAGDKEVAAQELPPVVQPKPNRSGPRGR